MATQITDWTAWTGFMGGAPYRRARMASRRLLLIRVATAQATESAWRLPQLLALPRTP
ncbi:MAG: hypothetical protein OXG44_03100 [Gammaproteobacteria bacterium]|nr:hypothetical protein [Gammaproteobacteria bacterium]